MFTRTIICYVKGSLETESFRETFASEKAFYTRVAKLKKNKRYDGVECFGKLL